MTDFSALLTVLSDPKASEKLLAQKEEVDAAQAAADATLSEAKQLSAGFAGREKRIADQIRALALRTAEHDKAAAALEKDIADHRKRVEAFNHAKDELRAILP